MSHEVLQPPGWASPRGYANGVAAEGRQVYVAGQIGWDADQRFVSDDFAAQARQAFLNVVDVLACAGATLMDDGGAENAHDRLHAGQRVGRPAYHD